MNIPDRVKVGGIEYRINITDVLKKGHDYLGEIDYEKGDIRIRTGQAKQCAYQTFLHELMHAIFSHCGYYEHDEGMIERLSMALAMIIRDNPWLLGGGDKAKISESAICQKAGINRKIIAEECEKIFSELIRGNGISNEAKTG